MVYDLDVASSKLFHDSIADLCSTSDVAFILHHSV